MTYFNNLGQGRVGWRTPSSGGGGIDSDAQAFITAANITDTTQKSAINTLVTQLKTYGIWSKMKALYPFVGGTAAQHRFNLKDPRTVNAAFYLDFFGGGTHSATGYLPNGNSYADTKLTPSLSQTVNSNGVGMYIGTLNTATGSDPAYMGGTTVTTTQATVLTVNKANTFMASRLNGSALVSSTINPLGLISAHRTSSTLTTLYKNSTNVGSGNSGGALTSNSIFIANIRGNDSTPYSQGYVNSEFRLAYISDGLDSIDMTNFYNAVQAFQTTLGRQV